MKDFDTAIKTLNNILEEKRPPKFSPLWIRDNARSVYKYVQKNIRTENDTIDWDTVTKSLERSFAPIGLTALACFSNSHALCFG